MKKFALVGLALAAALSLMAISASSAFAGSYASAIEVTELTGSNTTECANPKSEEVAEEKRCKEGTKAEEEETFHKFEAGTVPVICKMVSATAKITGTKSGEMFVTKSIVATPEYTQCTVAGQTATVKFNECVYNFGEPTGSASPFTVATIKIECPAGKEIVITATTAGCTIKLGSQTTTGTSTLTNKTTTGKPEDVTLAANISGITYTSSGGICGQPAGTRSNGVYKGSITIKGFSDAAPHTKQVNVTVIK